MFHVKYNGIEITCETKDDVLALVGALAGTKSERGGGAEEGACHARHAREGRLRGRN